MPAHMMPRHDKPADTTGAAAADAITQAPQPMAPPAPPVVVAGRPTPEPTAERRRVRRNARPHGIGGAASAPAPAPAASIDRVGLLLTQPDAPPVPKVPFLEEALIEAVSGRA